MYRYFQYATKRSITIAITSNPSASLIAVPDIIVTTVVQLTYSYGGAVKPRSAAVTGTVVAAITFQFTLAYYWDCVFVVSCIQYNDCP
jgi:hypothetical protein